MATIEDFEKIDMRVGRIVEVRDFPEAKKPAYQLFIDFGTEIGIKRSSSQIVDRYTKETLVGKLVFGVVNFPPRKVGTFESEVLTLGMYDKDGKVILAVPDAPDAVIGSVLA